MPKKLTILTGAGASYDCVDDDLKIVKVDNNFRPPLTHELFKNNDAFSNILAKYPGAELLSDEIRSRVSAADIGSEANSLEEILREIFNESDLRFKKQYWQIPLYLQDLLWEVSSNFVKPGSSTKYDRLIKLLINSQYDEILILTLNYDLFLDKALNPYFNFDNLKSYISNEIKLIKLHGSVNWSKKILNKVEDGVKADYLEILNSFNFDLHFKESPISIIDSLKRSFDGLLLDYPFITVPLNGNKVFSCPDDHIKISHSFLEECEDFLFIGFSGLDQHVCELFKNVKKVNKIKVINGLGQADRGELVLKRLKRYNSLFWLDGNKKKIENALYDGGFKEFEKKGDLANFLS